MKNYPFNQCPSLSLPLPSNPDFELRGGIGGGVGIDFVLLTLPAFLPSEIFFSILPKIRGATPWAPPLDPPLCDNLQVLEFFCNK